MILFTDLINSHSQVSGPGPKTDGLGTSCLAHLSHRLKVSFCDRVSTVVS